MRRAMGTLEHHRPYPHGLDLARAALLAAAAGVLLSACASVSPRKVPPPPGLSTAAVSTPLSGPVASYPVRAGVPQPPRLKRIDYPAGAVPVLQPSGAPAVLSPQAPPVPRAAPPAALGYPPSEFATASGAVPASVTARPRAGLNTSTPSALGSTAYAPYAPYASSVGEVPSADAAWKRATVPPQSRPETVGRVPPAAALAGFTLGAGDTVQIDVLGRPELSARSNISADGMITAGLLGPVNVAGLSTAQAAEKLTRAYIDGGYLVAPQVTVTMVEYQSQQLTVLGEVKNPGRFTMRTRLSVLDGLALSGGINEQGASLAYLLRPEDGVVTRYEIDLDALIQFGAGQQYFELLAGDTLVVPRTQLFYIYGEVKNPNAYKLKPGMTVIQALSLAGGLTDKGSDKRVDIRRRSPAGQLESVAVSLNESLMADDVVYVRERLF